MPPSSDFRFTRRLEWEGCRNVRDLGGLPTMDGHVVRPGAVIRADALDCLTEAGWSALLDHGVRTAIDLRNADEKATDTSPRPTILNTVDLPLDGLDDTVHWDAIGVGAPLEFYDLHLDAYPHLSVRAIEAIATAPPGGVVIHCGVGRDRTGLVVVLLLGLLEVPSHEIVGDHMLSNDCLAAFYAETGRVDQGRAIDELLRSCGSSYEEHISSLVDSLDVPLILRKGGLTDPTVDALRRRVLLRR